MDNQDPKRSIARPFVPATAMIERGKRPGPSFGSAARDGITTRGAGLLPRDLPQSQWLEHYARHFDTVEANSTFYRLPEAETFAAWAEQTPPGFVMAVKASRYLTHLKRLRDPEAPLQRLFDRAAALGSRLGPVLYQLPGFQKFDRPRLERFLQALPTRLPGRCRRRGARLHHVLEFRDPLLVRPGHLRPVEGT